eukprot:9732134-Lingulodinium_polyedra.AAC.1
MVAPFDYLRGHPRGGARPQRARPNDGRPIVARENGCGWGSRFGDPIHLEGNPAPGVLIGPRRKRAQQGSSLAAAPAAL